MAQSSRTISGRGHPEAKAGENIGQGKPREDVNEKAKANKSAGRDLRGLTDSGFGPLCGSAYFVAPLAKHPFSRRWAA